MVSTFEIYLTKKYVLKDEWLELIKIISPSLTAHLLSFTYAIPSHTQILILCVMIFTCIFKISPGTTDFLNFTFSIVLFG